MPEEKSLVEIVRPADEPKPVRWEDAPYGVLLRRECDSDQYVIRIEEDRGIEFVSGMPPVYAEHYSRDGLWIVASRDECVIIEGWGDDGQPIR